MLCWVTIPAPIKPPIACPNTTSIIQNPRAASIQASRESISCFLIIFSSLEAIESDSFIRGSPVFYQKYDSN